MASGPNFARMVDDADAKYVDTGVLGGCVTCTANVTMRLMGPMVILALPRSSRPTKKRAGLFNFYFKGMCSRVRDWLLASGPTFARTGDDTDAKYVDTGALGGRITRTTNVTIRPMGPMVILALPRYSWPKKKRAGLFSRLY